MTATYLKFLIEELSPPLDPLNPHGGDDQENSARSFAGWRIGPIQEIRSSLVVQCTAFSGPSAVVHLRARREFQFAGVPLAQLVKLHHNLAPFDDHSLTAYDRAIPFAEIEVRPLDLAAQSDALDLTQHKLCLKFADFQSEDDFADWSRENPVPVERQL